MKIASVRECFEKIKPSQICEFGRIAVRPSMALSLIFVGVVSAFMMGAWGQQEDTSVAPIEQDKVVSDRLSSAVPIPRKAPATQTAPELSWTTGPQALLATAPSPAYQIAIGDGDGVRLKTIVTR